MKKIFIFLLISYFAMIAPETHGATPASNKYYSLQITALPLSQKKDGFIIYKKLKEKGYLIYYYKVKIKNNWWMRLKVGIFPSIPKAQAFGKNFSQEEGFDYFVTKATVIVNAFKAEYEIITTPSAIWMIKDSINKEIFLFDKSKVETTDVLAYAMPVPSSDGKEIVFNYDSKMNTINVNGRKTVDKGANGFDTPIRLDSDRIAKDDLDPEISDLSRAIKTNPSNAEAYYNRGNIYRRKSKYDKAIADYNKTLEINLDRAEVYTNRGVAYGTKGQYDIAIFYYSRAIELDANAAFSYYNRGVAYFDKGQYDKAISDFNKAIEINPGYAKAYSNRGGVYFSLKEYDNAWNEVNKAQALGLRIDPEFLKMLREASGREK